MAERRRVELVIPVHNRRDLTLQCLRSLSRIDTDGLMVHVVIVDDGSTDGTSEAVLSSFHDVEIVPGDGSLFFTAATNRGIEAALRNDPDFIVTMNDDAVFAPDFLRSMVTTAESNPRSVVGALLLLWDEPHKVFQVSPRWETWSGGYRHWNRQTVWTVPSSPWEVELIVGNCVLFPVASIRECGLMDERRLPQFGDAEYTPRMRKNGWHLLVDPKARVFCQPNDPPPSLRSQSLGKIFKALFLNPYSGHSLRRRFNANYYGAPDKVQGAAAFLVFFFRWLLGRSFEGSYGATVEEPPLSDLYRDKTVSLPRS